MAINKTGQATSTTYASEFYVQINITDLPNSIVRMTYQKTLECPEILNSPQSQSYGEVTITAAEALALVPDLFTHMITIADAFNPDAPPPQS